MDQPRPDFEPRFEPVSDTRLRALSDELSQPHHHLELIREPVELARLSVDFHTYSPVLTAKLRGCEAQLAVKARAVEQVMTVAGACARHGVPLTVRGAGTGNYGQCVPLAGGVVLDTSPLQQLRGVDPSNGLCTAEPGCPLADLDRKLASHGRSLRMVPSTYRTATLGGFIAGGAGGIGSLRWGFLRDPGHLMGLEVVTVERQPRRLQLDAPASHALNHAYGSNGIITAVRLSTTESIAWQELVVGFDDWQAALEVARGLPGTAMLLNALCLVEATIAARLPWPAGCSPPAPGEHRIMLLAAPDSLPLLPHWVQRQGGTVIWQAAQGRSRSLPLRELTWNHTTLHWRGSSPHWTYLQMLMPSPEEPLLSAVNQRWGNDVLWHLEGVRQQGAPRLAALPLMRWRGQEDLDALIAQCRDLGAIIFNPHVITVEDGGLGVIDADQVAAKAAFDPDGLLNPGKLGGWFSHNRG